MIIKSNPVKLLSYLLFTFILINTTICIKYRSINGEGNNINQPSAGIPNTPFVRNVPPTSFFADTNNNLIHTPGEYTFVPETLFTCSAILPDGVFPLPRCVSNKLMSKQSKDNDMFDMSRLEKFKSKRKTSHIVSVNFKSSVLNLTLPQYNNAMAQLLRYINHEYFLLLKVNILGTFYENGRKFWIRCRIKLSRRHLHSSRRSILFI
ncbi:hypothetical protein C1645_123157 [Glomus cerebriforme]|uniref:Uncharacterized protein n=1 Tax=Glomus cerebriforme TaxID=658196 RepID=A0A397T1R7_9GLOM|nr:hypothetical protein C1645_123157 [Glomus cerebriforme]